MKKALSTFIFIVFILQSLNLSAQEEQIVIVRNDAAQPRVKREFKERNLDLQNAFKFDPFRLIIGEVNFSWETKIGRKSTLELELGPTISQLNGFNSTMNFNSDISYEQESDFGALASVAVRYYPLDGLMAFNKLYISPKFKYRSYVTNFTTTNADLLADISGSSTELIFSFNIGYQLWVSNSFAFDFYVGAGIGTFKSKRYAPKSTFDSSTNTTSYNWEDFTSNDAKISGVVGLKVSIGK